MGELRGMARGHRVAASRLQLAVALTCLFGLASAATSAQAAEKGGDIAMQFSVDAGNGFELRVDAERKRGEQTYASVSLSSERQTAVYVKRRGVRMTRNEIEFRLGSLGSVEMRFRDAKRFKLPPACGDVSVRGGQFVGRLHFRGEGAYTRAQAHKARGFVLLDSGSDRCDLLSQEVSSRPDRPERHEALLSSCGPARHLGFSAGSLGQYGYSFFSATMLEKVDGLEIYRIASSYGSDGDFSFDEENYRSAKVRPAWPFSGTGVYRDGELTGDLSVSLPGAEDTPLVPSGRAKLKKELRGGRTCGIDIDEELGGGWFAAPWSGRSAPEHAAAIGFDRGQ